MDAPNSLPIAIFVQTIRQQCTFLTDHEIGRLLDAARRDSILVDQVLHSSKCRKSTKKSSSKSKSTTPTLNKATHTETETEQQQELYVQHMLALGHRGDFPGASFGIYTEKVAKKLDAKCVRKWPNLHGLDFGRRSNSNNNSPPMQMNRKKGGQHALSNNVGRADEKTSADTTAKRHDHHLERKFGFVASLCHHYLHHVKTFHERIEQELEIYNFTGSGQVLAHFVPAAIDAAARGQLNAAEIETLITKVRSTRIPTDAEAGLAHRHRGLNSMVDIHSFVLQCQRCLVLPFSKL